jgi:acyl-coenzyme A synthetase/AMP-(fatty) acid ligase
MYLYSVSGLLSGARSVLYDGSPMKPSLLEFLHILSREGVTHFGTSAHYLSLLEQAGINRRGGMPNIETLKVITSTGSVLTEQQYYYVYDNFGPVQLSSIAGGTDIAGACETLSLSPSPCILVPRLIVESNSCGRYTKPASLCRLVPGTNPGNEGTDLLG